MFNILNESVENSFKNIPRNEEDYIASDGLLYCGKCKTPKQTEIVLMGEKKKPYCLCKCESERLKLKELNEKKQCLKDARRVSCFSDDRMHGWTFSADDGADPHITSVCKKYVENFEKMRKDGKGLLFFGTVGTGKTFMAAAIANALIDGAYRCKMVTMSAVAQAVQSDYGNRNSIYSDYNYYDLLVVDDLKSERNTEYMNEIVFNLIDSRYRSGLPMIVTSNITREEIANPSDDAYGRVVSRLLEMTIPVEIKGKDRRRQKMRKDYSDYSELLGL